MTWFNSIEIISKLIPITQILIVILTVFTIWANVHLGNLKKQENAKLVQEISQTKSVTSNITKKNMELESVTSDLVKKNIGLESELMESKNKLSDLKKKTEPRSLLLEQKTKLAQLLPSSPSFQIAAACRIMDSESYYYAEELISVFENLKWQIGKTNKTFLDDIQDDVVVAITEDTQIPIANQILKALNTVGIKASNQKINEGAITGIQANTIYLIVGARKKSP